MKIQHLHLLLALTLVLLALPTAAAAEAPLSTAPALCTDAALPPALQGGQVLGDVEGTAQNRIQEGPCSFCTDNSGCSTACYDDNNNLTTCGDYGVCDACREALVEIGRVMIGRTAKGIFWGVCEFTEYWQVTYQSVNSSSCPTYVMCEHDTDTGLYDPSGLICCDHGGGCFGTTC